MTYEQQRIKELEAEIVMLKLQVKFLISEIEKEKNLIEANKRIIVVFEQKIKDEINKLWEE